MKRNTKNVSRRLYKARLKSINYFCNYDTEYKWDLLSQQNVWSIPVPKEYLGKGFSWFDWINEIKKFIELNPNFNLVSLIIQHAATIYVILKYGNNDDKECIKLLMNGTISKLKFNSGRCEITIRENNIFINDVNNCILDDYLNFKKLLHGALSSFLILTSIKNYIGKNSNITNIRNNEYENALLKIVRSQDTFNNMIKNIL